MGYYIVSDGTAKPYRVHMRGASFANLQSLATMCEGRLIADVVAAMEQMAIRFREMQDVTEHFRGSGFKIFANILAADAKNEIWAIPAPTGGNRAFCDRMNSWAQSEGQPGLGYIFWRLGSPQILVLVNIRTLGSVLFAWEHALDFGLDLVTRQGFR